MTFWRVNQLREQWLKGPRGLGGVGFFGVLRYAQDDSKNKQRHDNSNGKGKNK
jgi:hypothetical protein